MAQNDMAWCGMACYGMACGMAWHGVRWHGTVWHGMTAPHFAHFPTDGRSMCGGILHAAPLTHCGRMDGSVRHTAMRVGCLLRSQGRCPSTDWIRGTCKRALPCDTDGMFPHIPTKCNGNGTEHQWSGIHQPVMATSGMPRRAAMRTCLPCWPKQATRWVCCRSSFHTISQMPV